MDFLFNKTKIVATVGPASNSKEKLEQLIAAGVDVFRLNFSHGTHEQHAQVIKNIKELNEELKTNVCMLQDLQGPKIRVEEVENNGVELIEGNKLIITTERVLGNSYKVSTSYQALVADVEVGDPILIDDGKLELKVIEKNGNEVLCEIIYGGILKSRKGINLPTTNVSAPSLTEKDYQDLIFGLENGVDWVALSFVRTAADVAAVQDIIKEKGKTSKVVAKIEKPQAVANIDEIIAVTDALMVARGDLGVEVQMEDVPVIQKMIIKKCNAAAKPVIVATQMMESMIDNPRPTRAETNDVANAVMDGADAVMLSAETASGKYPVLVVNSMTRIIRAVEDNVEAIYNKKYDVDATTNTFYSDSVLASACNLAKDTKAKAICALSSTGYSAFNLSKYRPHASIFIFTRHKDLLHRLNLLWGVRAIYFEKSNTSDETIEDMKQILIQKGYVATGDVIVNTATLPVKEKKHANMVKLSIVE